VLLQRSLQVSSAADVCSLVQALEQRLAKLAQVGLCSCSRCSTDSVSKPPAAPTGKAAANQAVQLKTTQRQQQKQCEELSVILQGQCTCTPACAASSCGRGVQKGHLKQLLVALQHLQGSVLAAVSSQPPDLLGVAAEQLVAVAAVAVLLNGRCSCRQHDGASVSTEVHIPAGMEGAGTAEVDSEQRSVVVGAWCCRCSQLLRLAQVWVCRASSVVGLHLGAVRDSNVMPHRSLMRPTLAMDV
jgi:hypothetical protein